MTKSNDEQRSLEARRQRRSGRALVVTDPVLMVRTASERIVLVREGKEVASVSSYDVAHLALHGPVTVSGAAMARLLDRGADVTMYSSSGRYRGTVAAAQDKNVYLLLAQVDAWKRDERRLAFARAALAGKIAGQRALVHRHALDHGSERCARTAERLARLGEQMASEPTVESATGVEGAAAAAYFEVFDELVRGEFSWPGRVRRPATDPVNALLGFGYALAVGEVARHLTFAGFDLRVGLVHGIRYGRESLPLDLVEELRPALVDRFVLRLVNRRELGASDFDTHEGGAVRLTPDAKRRVVTSWEETLVKRNAKLAGEHGSDADEEEGAKRVGWGAYEEDGSSWRYRIERQVMRLKRFLMKGEPYRALHARGSGPDGKRKAGRGDRGPVTG
jgi:CRISPR-associated protein Cas1